MGQVARRPVLWEGAVDGEGHRAAAQRADCDSSFLVGGVFMSGPGDGFESETRRTVQRIWDTEDA